MKNTILPQRGDLKLSKPKIFAVNKDNHCHLTDGQKYLVNFFNGKAKGNKPVSRHDFDPIEIITYLPNVALFDLFKDETGKLKDINVRLFGTALVDFFGEWTGSGLDEKGNKASFKETLPDTYNKVTMLINSALEHEKPMVLNNKETGFGSGRWGVSTLVVPLSKDNCAIDMIFLHTELIK